MSITFENCVFSTRETDIEEYFNYLFINSFDCDFFLKDSYFYVFLDFIYFFLFYYFDNNQIKSNQIKSNKLTMLN
jgi:hypothetical protein